MLLYEFVRSFYVLFHKTVNSKEKKITKEKNSFFTIDGLALTLENFGNKIFTNAMGKRFCKICRVFNV